MSSRPQRKILLLAGVDLKLNPYLLLFTEALRRQGLQAELSDKLSSLWLLDAPKETALHLQWVETLYCVRAPSSWKSKLVRRIFCNRLSSAMRSFLRLWFNLLAILVCRLRGAWIVYTVLNLESHSDLFFDRLVHDCATWAVLKLAHRVQVCSEAARDLVKARFKRRTGIVVVPLGNLIDHYPGRISRPEARERLGIAPELVVFLFLGLIRPYKGIEELVPAFLALGPDLTAARLLIAGAVPDKAFENRIAAMVGSKNGVRFLPGYVPDQELPIFLAASDLTVFPYRSAISSGGAVLALSFGRPIIAPDSPAFSHLVTDDTGILYDPDIPGALTAALRTGAQRAWDENEILRFAHRFDWQRLGPALRTLYEPASETART